MLNSYFRPLFAWPQQFASNWLNTVKGARPGQWLLVSGMVLAISVIVPAILSRLILNITPSIPAHLLWLSKNKHISKNDYILYTKKHPYITIDAPLIKQVRCVQGEHLTYKAPWFVCNGIYIAKTLKKTSEGKPLTPFVYDGVIPKGYVFALGTNPNSFDSRYLGLVKLSETKKAYRLW